MKIKLSLAAALGLATAMPALGDVNVYSYRQPELIQPLVEAFTEETGIDVNVAFLNQGMVERLEAEGDRSPADVVLTTDISRLAELVAAGVTQPVESEVLEAQKCEGPKRRLCTFVSDEKLPLYGGETILLDDDVVSLASSAGYGHTVGKTIIYGYLPAQLSDREAFELEVFGDRHAISRVDGPLYDRDNGRLKA